MTKPISEIDDGMGGIYRPGAIIAAPITSERLEVLAKAINAGLDTAYDSLLNTCILLAEAKEECANRGIVFKAWAEDNVKLSKNLVYRYASLGGQPDPAKAIEDYRAGKASAMRRLLARPTTSHHHGMTVTTLPLASEEEDDDDGAIIRGLGALAEDAASFALDDNVKLTNEIVAAVREAAKALADLAGRLERKYYGETKESSTA